jgi:hypothetical protein
MGKHSTANFEDGYQGSGDWVLLWHLVAPDRLKTTQILFRQ